jgi:glutathione S-transferase
MGLHAWFGDDYYAAEVTGLKKSGAKPVKVWFKGYGDGESWVALSDLKSKWINEDWAPQPKAKVKAKAKNNSAQEKLKLYTSVRCPFGRRALIACAEKKLTPELVYIPLSGELKKLETDPAAIPPEFPGLSADDLNKIKADYKKDINSAGEVPTLVSNGTIIWEADVIAEFVDDAFPGKGTTLMPNNEVQRSRIRHYMKVLGGPGGVSGMYGLLMNQDPAKDQEILDKVHGHWAQFAKLANADGPFFLGKRFSLADVMLMPMYDQFRFVWSHYRGAEIIPSDAAAFPWVPRAQAWAKAVEERESFKKYSQGKETYVKAYAGYAAARGVSQFGK